MTDIVETRSAHRKRHADRLKTQSSNWRNANKEKRHAHYLVQNAKRTGLLVQSATCESCDVEAKTQAHHDDYASPLVVKWLCAQCHRKEHGAVLVNTNPARGERVSGAKLTADAVLEIKKILGTLSQSQIARNFNVSESNIRMIATGRTWKHLSVTSASAIDAAMAQKD